jgi:hypothetical protein
MIARMTRIGLVASGLVMAWSALAVAQQPPAATQAVPVVGPAAPPTSQPPMPAAGAEVVNFGTLPFTAQEQLLLRPEDKTALRTIEDRHLKELRQLEDRYEADLRVLRQRQADERDTMRKSFRR